MMSMDGTHWSLIRIRDGRDSRASGGCTSAPSPTARNFVAFGSSRIWYVGPPCTARVALNQYSPAQAISGARTVVNFVAPVQTAASDGPEHHFETGARGLEQRATPTAAAWTSIAYGGATSRRRGGDIALSRSDANCGDDTLPTTTGVGNIHMVRSGRTCTRHEQRCRPVWLPSSGSPTVSRRGIAVRGLLRANCIIKGLKIHQMYWVSTGFQSLRVLGAH